MTTKGILTTSRGTNAGVFSPRDWFLFFAIGSIWGSSFLFMAYGLDSFHPGLVAFIRVASAALFFLCIPNVRRTRIDRGDWARITTLSITWAALPFTLFPIAQQWIDSGTAGMLNGTTPIMAAVLTAFLLRSLPRPVQILGIVMGFTGVALITLPTAQGASNETLGVLLALVASASYAVSITISVPVLQKYGSLPVMGRMMWLATIWVTPLGLSALGESEFSWTSMAATVTVGVLGSGLAFILVGKLASSVGSTRGAFVAYLIPVVAVILGALVRDERAAPLAVAGIVLVIAGAFLASRRER